jgi:hypothetical protein
MEKRPVIKSPGRETSVILDRNRGKNNKFELNWRLAVAKKHLLTCIFGLFLWLYSRLDHEMTGMRLDELGESEIVNPHSRPGFGFQVKVHSITSGVADTAVIGWGGDAQQVFDSMADDLKARYLKG